MNTGSLLVRWFKQIPQYLAGFFPVVKVNRLIRKNLIGFVPFAG
jgi:hypothetical protein